MDAPTFRQQFPEFACEPDYPTPQIMFWAGLAGTMLNADRWADMLDYGVCLFIAHHLAAGQRDVQTAEAGGTPGTVSGPMTAKSVDKVSASYDTSAVTLVNGGFWNSTSYGIQLLQLARYVGAGGVQF